MILGTFEKNPDYTEAWNNKGLEYLESLGESSKAVECFHRAIECARKADSSNKDLAEIYNNLGVAYYEIEDYVKSAESR